jgi:hypothetical protein
MMSSIRRTLALVLQPPSVTRVQAIVAAILLSLSPPSESVTAAQPSRLVLVRVQPGTEQVLLDGLTRIAKRRGMVCVPQHATSNSTQADSGIHCHWSNPAEVVNGSFSAVGLLSKNAVFVFVVGRNVSSPNGDLEPPMEGVLLDFQQEFSRHDGVRSFEECRAPDFDRCLTN